MKTPKIILFDLDGTLCNEVCWTPEDCLNATPTHLVEFVKKLNRSNMVVVYTARQNNLMNETHEWLEKQGIGRCPVCNFKVGTDFYVDDKCINIKDYKDLEQYI